MSTRTWSSRESRNWRRLPWPSLEPRWRKRNEDTANCDSGANVYRYEVQRSFLAAICEGSGGGGWASGEDSAGGISGGSGANGGVVRRWAVAGEGGRRESREVWTRADTGVRPGRPRARGGGRTADAGCSESAQAAAGDLLRISVVECVAGRNADSGPENGGQ